jgi:hypothetical protein
MRITAVGLVGLCLSFIGMVVAYKTRFEVGFVALFVASGMTALLGVPSWLRQRQRTELGRTMDRLWEIAAESGAVAPGARRATAPGLAYDQAGSEAEVRSSITEGRSSSAAQ